MQKAIILIFALFMISAFAIPAFATNESESDYYGNEAAENDEEEGLGGTLGTIIVVAYVIFALIIAFPYYNYLSRKGSYNFYAMESAEQVRLKKQGFKFIYNPFGGGFKFAIVLVLLNFAAGEWGGDWNFLSFLPDWYWNVYSAPWFLALLMLPGYIWMLVTLQVRAKNTKITIIHMIIMGLFFALIIFIPIIGATTAVVMWLVRLVFATKYQEPGYGSNIIKGDDGYDYIPDSNGSYTVGGKSCRRL